MFELEKYFQSQQQKLSEIAGMLRAGDTGTTTLVTGLAGSFKSVFAATLHELIERQTLVVASDSDSAMRMRDDIETCLGPNSVRLFGKEHHRGSTVGEEPPLSYIEALRYLHENQGAVVVCDPNSFPAKVPPPARLKSTSFMIKVGNPFNLIGAVEELTKLDFERKDFVESFGDFAIRGGILDVFPFVGENPIRIELVGDTIESLREFDPLSQRSIKELSAATIVPNVFSSNRLDDRTASLLDYLQADAVIVMEEPDLIRHAIETQMTGFETDTHRWQELEEVLPMFQQVHIHHLGRGSEKSINFNVESQPSFNGSVKTLRAAIHKLEKDSFTVVLTADSQSELSRLKVLLDETPEDEDEFYSSREGKNEADQPNTSPIQFSLEALHEGFVLPEDKFALFTEHQIFNRLRRRWKKHKNKSRSVSSREIHELRKGDYVVHDDHGIGRFDGLQRITVRSTTQEVMKLRYEESDTLYVNLNYLGKVKKYSSKEGHIPKLSRLGTADWERLKSRAKNRIKDIARDLIQLYAQRKSTEGYAFQRDTPWQRELEASFMYEDTFDQAKATLDVKQDMEAAHPMDRLICGDVGFGKTEVAVRAAFKAVMDGKQVALLVPTTILAVQHHRTFLDRTSRYTVNVQAISRFKSKKEQASIVELLKAGAIDIIIGTHRLLSKDIGFKDLGLLIIDEEHRFGVSAKEKLRQLRAQVDTLTLTATPIPRTLHFSLLGARDLSIIATPPRNRLPVITEITKYGDELIKEAVLREIHRGGQVYFVHDRIQSIEGITVRLQQNMPTARVRFAHGQMHAHELEEVMLDFLEKRFDVLVCTKIIESGLDIPNVNTIIINRADKFGMAELYQLRGRVGRSNTQAYAYLLTPPLSTLTKPSLQRLQAVEEFTELGSGFNLAMRDLEIRGAGNLLGGEQSGFIETMGFETYSRILEEAVSELREQEFKSFFEDKKLVSHKRSEAVVEIDFEAYIPTTYVGSDIERLTLYRRLYAIETQPQLDDIEAELIDRFGSMSSEVENLFGVVRVRLAASKLRFPKVSISTAEVEIELPPESETSFYEGKTFQNLMVTISSRRKSGFLLKQVGKKLTLLAKLPDIQVPQARLQSTMDILTGLASENEALSTPL